MVCKQSVPSVSAEDSAHPSAPHFFTMEQSEDAPLLQSEGQQVPLSGDSPLQEVLFGV